MTSAWARAHHVGMVALLTVVGCAALLLAGTVSFTAPRQPIPLVWPVGSILVSGLFLVLDTGFGMLTFSSGRAALDRWAAAAVVWALGGVIVAVSEVAGVPRLLLTWMAAVAASAMWTAAVSQRAAWAAALVIGLLGVAAEFITPWTPISRALGGDGALGVCVILLGLGTLVYAIFPVLWPVTRLARWSPRWPASPVSPARRE